MEDKKVYIEYKDLFQIIKKRKLMMIIMIAFILILSFVYRNYFTKPVYEAKVSLIIGNEISEGNNQFDIDNVKTIQDYMQTYVMILKTNTVSERTINKLGLNISANDLKSHMQALPQPKTQFMEVKLNWGNPQETVLILDSLIEGFIEEATRIYPAYTIKILEKTNPYVVEALGDKLYYALAFIASLLVCLLIVILIEFFDNTIKTDEDVEKYLALPVMGSIPKYKKAKGYNIIDAIKNKNYSILDAYRTLRTNLYYYSQKHNIKTIVITSARPKEGKTTAASMLALVLALGGKKTLLVDCDMRNPTIHEVFGTRITGLSNMLMNDSQLGEVLMQAEAENLFIIPGGIKPFNPVELISSEHMKELMDTLKGMFDYIILDTPPVGLFTEAQVLSQYSDGYLLVVSSGESDREATTKAQRLVQLTDGNIIGVLLNKVVSPESKNKYDRYYG